MSTCPECNHPSHADNECVVTVGYDAMNGDHECGCPGVTEIARREEIRAAEYPADQGHRFTITMTSRGSSKVVGDEHHTDSEWESDPWTVTVRAWNLRDALVKASQVPFAVWAGDRTADDE
jgi:hypothetical protein